MLYMYTFSLFLSTLSGGRTQSKSRLRSYETNKFSPSLFTT